jgi:PPOX class probable F420-dependent enzyme
MTESNISGPFAYLYPEQFVVLTTYRKDGTGVPTTVWFANDNGNIYVTTGSSAGKIKRIRNNGRVQLTPSDRVGNTHGQTIEASAREALAGEYEHIDSVLAEKYKEQYNAIRSQRTSGQQSTYIVITPA